MISQGYTRTITRIFKTMRRYRKIWQNTPWFSRQYRSLGKISRGSAANIARQAKYPMIQPPISLARQNTLQPPISLAWQNTPWFSCRYLSLGKIPRGSAANIARQAKYPMIQPPISLAWQNTPWFSCRYLSLGKIPRGSAANITRQAKYPMIQPPISLALQNTPQFSR